MEFLIILLIILPLISAGLCTFTADNRRLSSLSIYITFATFVLSLLLLIFGSFETLKLGGIFEFYADRLGLLLSTYILLVSLIIHKYSQKYMVDDPGYKRFFVLLDIMTANLVALVLSGNLLLLLGSWHLMGLLLYFMLNHNFESRSANKYASLSLFTHRLADIPLLIAVVLLFREFGTLSIPEISAAVLSEDFNGSNIGLITFLIVLSAILKSAQFPFHLWLVYSMEGPTPVSALMHAGIVNAGAFLVNRFAPLFVHDSYGLHLAFVIGSLTAILGSALMLIQNDVKRALGYSTVGQMGYMIMELGIGAFALAVYHMMAHGVFKATLFLYSGNVIHGARKDPNVPEDEFYTAITKGKEISYKVPWAFYGVLTVVIPLLIVILTHLIIEEEFLEYKTSLILLFFGWITGAQVLISTFRVGREKPILTSMIAIFSLLIFLLGYVIMGHGLKVFLYPQEGLMERIYHQSFAENPLFYVEIIFMAILILFGWIFMYYAGKEKYLPVHLSLYTHFSRELYIPDIYVYIKEIFSKIVKTVSKLSLASAVAGSFGFAVLGVNIVEIPIVIIAAVLVPLFPLSLITALLLKKFGIAMYVILPIVGIFLVGIIDVPAVIRLLASLTFIVHSVRLFAARNMNVFALELYCGLMSLIWLLDKRDLVLGLFIAMAPLIAVVIHNILKGRYGSSEFSHINGLLKMMPKFSIFAIPLVLYTSAIPFFPTFYTVYESVNKSGMLIVLLVSVGWMLLGMGVISSVGRMFFGKAKPNIFYKDINSKEALILAVSLIIVSLTGLLYSMEV